MTPKLALRSIGIAAIMLAAALLIRTGSAAAALGAVVPVQAGIAGASDPASMTFWFQLSFIRLFATVLAGLGFILLWCQGRLSPPQQHSLVMVLGGVLGALSLTAAVQQIAVWTTNAGWVLVASLVLGTMGCVITLFRNAEHAA